MPRERRRSKGLFLQPVNGIWHAVGSIAGERIRKSLGTRDEGKAEELRALYEARLWKRSSYGEEAVRTFEEAAERYMKAGGEARFLAPLIRHFKGRAVGSIKPAEIRAAAAALYPGAPSTRNRQGIVPARAVVMHAHDLGWCGAITVKHFPVPKSTKHKPVGKSWLDAFIARSDFDGLPHLSAIVLFMNQTGARVSEAVRLTADNVDLGKRVAVLEKTKTDEWVVKHLTAELVSRFAALIEAGEDPLFRYTDPRSVNRRIKAVTRRAGIASTLSHSVGRHSFGTNAMASGASIKEAMEAGGWKSAKLFMETYVHSEDGGKKIAARFDAETGPIDTNRARSIIARRGNARK